jgi:hypothetical protein
MPDLSEFLNKKEVVEQVHSTLEKLNGVRPCAKCEEDVDGGLWDPINLIMTWSCSSGHENSFQVR